MRKTVLHMFFVGVVTNSALLRLKYWNVNNEKARKSHKQPQNQNKNHKKFAKNQTVNYLCQFKKYLNLMVFAHLYFVCTKIKVFISAFFKNFIKIVNKFPNYENHAMLFLEFLRLDKFTLLSGRILIILKQFFVAYSSVFSDLGTTTPLDTKTSSFIVGLCILELVCDNFPSVMCLPVWYNEVFRRPAGGGWGSCIFVFSCKVASTRRTFEAIWRLSNYRWMPRIYCKPPRGSKKMFSIFTHK